MEQIPTKRTHIKRGTPSVETYELKFKNKIRYLLGFNIAKNNYVLVVPENYVLLDIVSNKME